MPRLTPQESLVIVLDVQERLVRAMPATRIEDVVRSVGIFAEAKRTLGVPLWYSEQYPAGLGPTTPQILAPLEAASARRFEKISFSLVDVPQFPGVLSAQRATVAVVLGMEAHVCVHQTVRDLLALGLGVHVPVDGVCSRRDDHRERGLLACERAGAVLTTSETIVFDWLRVAKTPEFRAMSRVIR